MSSLDRLIGDGSRCSVLNKDVAFHTWVLPARKGSPCQCGTLRVKRIRRSDGSIESEPNTEVPNECSRS